MRTLLLTALITLLAALPARAAVSTHTNYSLVLITNATGVTVRVTAPSNEVQRATMSLLHVTTNIISIEPIVEPPQGFVTQRELWWGTLEGAYGLGQLGGWGTHVSTKYTAASSYVPQYVSLQGYKVGNPGGTITARILTDVAGVPGVEIASGSKSATLFTDGGTTDVYFSTVGNITSGSSYWLCVSYSLSNQTEYWAWHSGGSGTGTLRDYTDCSSGTYNVYGGARQMFWRMWGQ